MDFNEERLRKIFPINIVNCFETTGEALGYVIKFHTFYLKIYEHSIDEYVINGYTYAGNISNQVFESIVKKRDIRKWASQFTKDNYLIGYREIYG